MAIKFTNIISRPSKIYPNWNFWFDNTSGNPDPNQNSAVVIKQSRNIKFHLFV
jgi:hypothetical protein